MSQNPVRQILQQPPNSEWISAVPHRLEHTSTFNSNLIHPLLYTHDVYTISIISDDGMNAINCNQSAALTGYGIQNIWKESL